MKQEPTLEQAIATYKATVRDTEPYLWPNWVDVVANSITVGHWCGGNSLPAYAKEVYEAVKAESNVSLSDSQ